MTDMETRMRLLEAQVQEHVSLTTERFKAGNQAFNSIRESIGQLGQVVQPKPMTLSKLIGIIGLTVTIVLAAAGALWGLSTQLSKRPTIEQVREVVSDHANSGHPAMGADIATIKQEQAVQGVKLEGIEKSVGEIKAFVREPRRPR